MNLINKVKDYTVAFISVGSWCSIFTITLLSEKYVNYGRVLLFITASIVIALLGSAVLLLLFFKRRILQFPRTSLLLSSISAISLVGCMMHYNQSNVLNFYDIRAPILEKGIEKSKRKNLNRGAFCKLKTPFGDFKFQVSKDVYASACVGDTLHVNIEIGKMQFIKIEQ